MKLSAPKFIVWLIALIIGVAGLVVQLFIPSIQVWGFWLVLIGLALMLLATAISGL